LSDVQVVTAAERPDLVDAMQALGASPWPAYLNHDNVCEQLWRYVYELAADWQFALLEAGELAAVGNCLPIRWDGDPGSLPDRGIDAVLEDGVDLLRTGAAPTAASALLIVMAPGRLGVGLSSTAIRTMAGVVADHGLTDLVAPVRPTRKHEHPHVPIEEYVRWTREDGLAQDPWIRAHQRVGGEILGTASAAMRVTADVAAWEGWTEMSFPESGEYVVPGGLAPVAIDRERDVGDYLEPACWMRHRCG
jgi:hypothetical protein